MLLPVHPQLGARLAAHSLSVQLGKHMLSTASNERVPITDQYHTESNAPCVKDRGPKRGIYNQIAGKSGVWGGETNVFLHAALLRLYSSIITQTARRRSRRRAHRRRHRRRRESVPMVFVPREDVGSLVGDVGGGLGLGGWAQSRGRAGRGGEGAPGREWKPWGQSAANARPCIQSVFLENG